MAISQSEYDKIRGVKSDTPANDIGVATSMLAGLGSGIFKILKAQQH